MLMQRGIVPARLADRPGRDKAARVLIWVLFLLASPWFAGSCWCLSSTNIPLDSPVYRYLEKLAGFGLVESDIQGLKPYSKAEAARLLLEAEQHLALVPRDELPLARELTARLRDCLPREIDLRLHEELAPVFDVNPLASARLRYVWHDGLPRDYNRDVYDKAGQSAFGFIGGNLRRQSPSIVHTTGTEGTPLMENVEGVVYDKGSNVEFRPTAEAWLSYYAAGLVEMNLLHTPDHDSARLHRAYLKLGGGGLELEAGRDANWFGPGFRGTTTLTNNAKNFDLVKLSSPEPVDVGWVKEYLGLVKYAVMVSRFDETGSGSDYRHPWFAGIKVAVKPKPWFEIGANLVRQEGGPNVPSSSSLDDRIFGGAVLDGINSIAGIDLRFRVPCLNNAELYGEFSGEDSADFWPFVESYVAGIYLPNLTYGGRDDLRFEYFWGSVILYSDYQFPAGYVYHGMTPGHSQGTAAQEFYLRYSHWFSARNTLALELFHTERGQKGRLPGQEKEEKDAVRLEWRLPAYGDWDLTASYGWEKVRNLNLVPGIDQTNQLVRLELAYRY